MVPVPKGMDQLEGDVVVLTFKIHFKDGNSALFQEVLMFGDHKEKYPLVKERAKNAILEYMKEHGYMSIDIKRKKPGFAQTGIEIL